MFLVQVWRGVRREQCFLEPIRCTADRSGLSSTTWVD